MTFADAMNKYGSDKPDTRFDMLIQDISDWADNTDFVVFKNAIADGGSVKAIVAKNAASVYTRKKLINLQHRQRESVQRVLPMFAGQMQSRIALSLSSLKTANLMNSSAHSALSREMSFSS